MPPHPSSERETPGRWQALVFRCKTRLFQLRRAVVDLGNAPPLHRVSCSLVDAPVAAEAHAPLWAGVTPEEFPLTAGKVENLRRAARAFHGLEIPAGALFSFWRQLGRTTRHRGFTHGRELREGCLVPAIGGGLCQISGLLYQAALAAGLDIVERHAHSRLVAGSSAERGLDATVFWNYVDLRFRSAAAWRLEVELTAADLKVRIRSREGQAAARPAAPPAPTPRAAPSGDCLTCGMEVCFRHPSATAAHAPSSGHSVFLLDARWPEFDRWCAGHARPGDRWLLPLDGRRWKKPGYAWTPPAGVAVRTVTAHTLLRSFRQRGLPAQGGDRQRFLLQSDASLARHYAAGLTPACRHLVVSQNLLPHLWTSGALGGRSFDVLMQRWPLRELHARLDEANRRHPASTTLGDFRAGPDLVRAEDEALAAAGRLITPHRAIARHCGARAWLVDWEMPAPLAPRPAATRRIFFPASRLGRKGAFELAAALRSGLTAEICYAGRAIEGGADPWSEFPCTAAGPGALASCHAVVLPAWIEHQPRLALLALASGIPVVATAACGLPGHPLLHELASPDPAGLAAVLHAVLGPATHPAPP